MCLLLPDRPKMEVHITLRPGKIAKSHSALTTGNWPSVFGTRRAYIKINISLFEYVVLLVYTKGTETCPTTRPPPHPW